MPDTPRPADAPGTGAPRTGGPGSAAAHALVRPALEGTTLGARWEVLGPQDAPGLPGYVAAVVGRCGAVLVSQVVDGGPLTVEQGRLYCATTSLEGAVDELGALARQLAGRLHGLAPASAVYAALVVPGARSSLFHRDVLVAPPRGLARGIEAFPAVQLPAAVAKLAAALEQVASQALVPRPAPTRPHGAVAGASAIAQTEPAPPEGVPSRRQAFERRSGPLSQAAGTAGPPRAKRSRLRRGWTGPQSLAVPRGGAVLAVAVFVAAGVATWYATRQAGATSGASPAPVAQAAGAAAATTTVPSFLAPLSYPGHQAGDVVAGTTGALQLDGARFSLAAPVVSPSLVGHLLLCVHVSVHAGRAGLPAEGAVTWAVRSPSGLVEHPSRLADDALLSTGQLVPGDYVQGRLCFEEPGQAGLYVLTYAPRAAGDRGGRNFPRARGVWLMRLPAS